VTSRSAHFNVVIIGSGAGGGTMAAALAPTGCRILVIERGESLPRHADNWDPNVVWMEQRYRAREQWFNSNTGTFRPNTHYCVGGNTKFWGSVLYRLRPDDFEQTRHVDGESPAWPIRYEDLAPYYDRAEKLYQVHGQSGLDPTDPPRPPFPYPPIDHTGGIAKIIDAVRARGLHPVPLPLGLIRPGEADGCQLCSTCNSFPCMIGAKGDAESCGIRPAREWPNVELRERTMATALVTDGSGKRVIAVDVVTNGRTERIHADVIVVACGAVNSAALLLRSGDGGLANSSGLVGRNYMAHVTTMFSAYRWDDVDTGPHAFHKTIAINDFYRASASRPYPLGHIQSQGSIHPEMVRGGAPPLLKLGLKAVLTVFPRSLKHWTDHSIQWLAMTEDLPLPHNRVTLQDGQIRLDYHPSNLQAHRELKRVLGALLRELGFTWIFPLSFGLGNTTHQCGTLKFGTDPRTSVLDPFCRTHDIENLFVVDASFFPSSAAVNPALTIVAQALRVAEHIAENDLRVATPEARALSGSAADLKVRATAVPTRA
jgi:choline dehydrogenase-like flavoprotein